MQLQYRIVALCTLMKPQIKKKKKRIHTEDFYCMLETQLIMLLLHEEISVALIIHLKIHISLHKASSIYIGQTSTG